MAGPCDGWNYNGKFFKSDAAFKKYLNKEEGRRKLEDDYKEVLKEEIKDLKGQVTDVFNASVEALKGFEKASKEEKVKMRNTVKEAVSNSLKIFRDGLGKKELTKQQYKSIITKVSRINTAIDTNKAVAEFVEHVDKVLNNADYKARVTKTNKNRVVATKKLSQAKIVKDSSDVSALQRLLSLNPDSIPSEMMPEYNELIDAMATEKLSGEGVGTFVQRANNVVAAYENKNAKNVDLKQRVDDFRNDFEDLAEDSFKKLVSKMREKENITLEEEEYLLDNEEFFTDKEGPRTEKNVKEPLSKEERTEKKESIKNSIEDLKNLKELGVLGDSTKTKVDNILDNMSEEYLDSLSDKDLNRYQEHFLNLGDGFISVHLNTIEASLEKFNDKKSVEDAFKERKEGKEGKFDVAIPSRTKSLAYRVFGSKSSTKRTTLGHQIQRFQKWAINDVLGIDVKKVDLNEIFFGRTAQAIGKNQGKIAMEEQTIFNPLDKYIEKSVGSDASLIFKAKLKASLFAIQRIHEMSDNKTIDRPVADYFSDKFYADKGDYNYYNKETKKIIKEEVAKFEALGFDSQKYFNSKEFSHVEKKIIEEIDRYYKGDIRQRASDTSFNQDGKVLPIKEGYIPISFVGTGSKAESIESQIKGKVLEYKTKSFKAGNILEKTGSDGGLDKVIDLDITGVARRYSEEVNTRYHLLEQSRRNNALIKDLLKNPNLTEEQKLVIRSIEILQDKTLTSINSNGLALGLYGKIAGSTSKALLVGLSKAIPELASNAVGAVPFADTYFRGVKGYQDVIKSGVDYNAFLYEIGAPQMERLMNDIFLFPKLKGQGGADVPFETRVNSVKGADPEVVAILKRIYKNSNLPEVREGLEQLSNLMLATPDKIIAVPLHHGVLMAEFKKLTGTEMDVKRVAEKDIDYIDKYRKQIKQAALKADVIISQMVSSKNPAVVAGKYQVTSDASQADRLLTSFNSTFRAHSSGVGTGVYSILSKMQANGAITRSDAANLAAKLGSQFAYTASKNFVMKGMFATLASALGYTMYKDEEEDEDLTTRNILGAAVNTYMSNSGAISSNVANFGVEVLNEKYGEGITYEGAYNKARSSINFSSYDPSKEVATNSFNLLMSSAGSMGILASEITKDVKKIDEDLTTGLVTAGLGTGVLPFGKDIRAMQSRFKYGSIPPVKEQQEIYKSGSAKDIKDLEKSYISYTDALVKNEALKQYKEHGKDFMNNPNKYLSKFFKGLYDTKREGSYINSIHKLTPGKLKERVQGSIDAVRIQMMVKTGRVSDEAKEMMKMKKSEVSDDILIKLRDASSSPGSKKFNDLVSLANELYHLGLISKSVVDDYAYLKFMERD